MVVSELRLMEILQKKFKLSEQDAKTLTQEISEGEQKIYDAIDKKFDSRESSVRNDIAILRSEIQKHFATKEDIANVKSDILRWTFTFVFGAVLLNIIAIVGAIMTLANILK